jgi:hypothetical protein
MFTFYNILATFELHSHYKYAILTSILVQYSLHWSHYELLFQKKMLINICVKNYGESYGFVNDVYETFQDYTKIISKLIIWI